MNSIKNIYKKSFVRAIASAICLVLSMIIVYSFSNQSPPNLLLLGLASFGAFYLSSLLIYKVKEKYCNK